MELLEIRQPSVTDLVGAVVGANGQIPLAAERLNKRGFATTPEDILATLASDPTAIELMSRQFRVKAMLTTYQMLTAYQAELLVPIGDDERPMTQQGAVQGFSAISSFFNSLTETKGQQMNINVMDKILAIVTPEEREAIITLAATEPTLPPPTPIRKRGRPPNSQVMAQSMDELIGELTP